MYEWETCGVCGARVAPDADWCGQCYAPIRERSDASVPGPPPASEPPKEIVPASRSMAWRMPASGDIELVEISPSDEPSVAPDSVFVLRHEPLVISRGTRRIVTVVIGVLAFGSDALFFPHVAYMLAYGAFVGLLSVVVLRRLWGTRVA
jgi:hypothetical protein